jgi:hypothetical protein
MADGFAMARFKARLLAPAKSRELTPEERATLLMRAVTMDEIRAVATQLGIPFGVAYRERRRLYERCPLDHWVETLQPAWRFGARDA